MSIKYDSKREALSEIINKATVDATYVIPDLQRPYVWTPRQVTLLIDSLFKGWPFGSLLLWEVKPNCFEANEGIPHRPFWQVVDKTKNDQSTKASALGQPATYQMVLDGQQRVQSLIIALGGDQWGFQLYDYEWALDLRDRRAKPSNHWSKASLCIDLNEFKAELAVKQNKVRKIEIGKILEWVILDASNGQSPEPRPGNYEHPLFSAIDNPGRFVRLSRLWNLVQKDLSESEYEELLEPLLEEHKLQGDALSSLLRPLAQFMKVVESVKINSFVHALQIESFELTPQWSKDDYSDAIVNIFTRLNTAGRTLTREEITLAWLKIGWDPAVTDAKTAGQCLDDLKSALGDQGFRLETDEIVRLISFVWAVEHRSGNLLDSKDLLKGDIVRSMAHAVAGAWKKLIPRLESGAELIKKHDLVENQGSFNAVIVYLTWYRIVFDKFESLSGLQVVNRDSLEKTLKQLAAQFLDRWIFGSMWANVWGDTAVLNFKNFASDLNGIFVDIQKSSSEDFEDEVKNGIEKLMNRVSVKATDQVTNVVVRDRKRVYTYYSLLWVWHRLDESRWQNSSIPMRTGRKRTGKLEVDHTIADAWWQRKITENIEEKLKSFPGTEEEKLLLAPDGFSTKQEAQEFINLLGNCSLLDKSFNISKSDKPMWHFLKDVHEIIKGIVARADWEVALSLTSKMTDPTTVALKDLVDEIKRRDALIRKELNEFISGNRHRVDVAA